MDYQNSISNHLPPSPIDNYFPPPPRKECNLHINTNNNGTWQAPVNLFSPPLSPNTCDRYLISSGSKTKGQQQQQQQQVYNVWHTNLHQVDIDTLTLENAKLQRANRLLKLDRENWLERRVKPLEQHIRELTMSHVRWQRAAKLLQQDLEEAQRQLASWKLGQITRFSGMGPEYQFLVDMIHQLQTQISSQNSCKDKLGGKTTCDTIDGKDYTEYSVLVDKIQLLEKDLGTAHQQLGVREQEATHYKSELSRKDQLVAQLETDFSEMNNQLHSFQHMLEEGGIITQTSDYATPSIKSTTVEMQMMLSATSRTRNKRRLVGIKENKCDDGGPIAATTVKDKARCDTMLDLKTRHGILGGEAEGGKCQNDGAIFDKMTYDLPPTTVNKHYSTPDIHTARTKRNHFRAASSSIYSSTSTRIQSWDNIGSQLNAETTMTQSPESLGITGYKPSTLVTFTSYPLTAALPMRPMPSIFVISTKTLVQIPGTYSSPTTQQLPSTTTTTTTTDGQMNDSSHMGKQIVWSMFVGHEPFAPFVLMTLFIGFSSTMGIDHDWLVPITLMALFSGYLWRGAFFGIRIKVNFQDN
ncbi:unnamed protein product [Absidia cylindrospora]